MQFSRQKARTERTGVVSYPGAWERGWIEKMALFSNVEEVRETLGRIQKNLECPICLELLSDPYSTQCSHPFCRACIYTVISSNKEARCPLCKEPISKRSMNENARLADIVEAVKDLEQAIIKDSGIQCTPPRQIPHSHEATGTPGLILHSLLHPTPQKPPIPEVGKGSGIRKEEKASYSDISSKEDLCAHHPSAVDRKADGELTVRRRKQVRFAATKTSKKHPKIAKTSTSGSQAALLKVIEGGNFEMSSHTTESKLENTCISVCFKQEVQQNQSEEAMNARSPGVQGEANAIAELQPMLEESSSPVRKKPRLDQWCISAEVQVESPQKMDITKVLETPAVITVSHQGLPQSSSRPPLTRACSQTLKETSQQSEHVVSPSSFCHPNPSIDPQCQTIAETPWLPLGGTEARTGPPGSENAAVSVHTTEMGSVKRVCETPFIVKKQEDVTTPSEEGVVVETPLLRDKHSDAEMEAMSNESILAEETQVLDNPCTNSSSEAQQSDTPLMVAETQEPDAASLQRCVSQQSGERAPRMEGGENQIDSPPAHQSDGCKHLSPTGGQTQCIEETQFTKPPSPVQHHVHVTSEPSHLQNPSSSNKNTTLPLGPPSIVDENPSERPKENLNSTGSTTPDLSELQNNNNFHTMPLLSPDEQDLPENARPLPCSSPKSASTLTAPIFTSPPFPQMTQTSLNHSISPSIPLQNAYTNSNSKPDKAISDTPCIMRSRVAETQLDQTSVPSSQQSPVLLLSYQTPVLPGLYNSRPPHRNNPDNPLCPSTSQDSLSLANSGSRQSPADCGQHSNQNGFPRNQFERRKFSTDSSFPLSFPNSIKVIPDSLVSQEQGHTSQLCNNGSTPSIRSPASDSLVSQEQGHTPQLCSNGNTPSIRSCLPPASDGTPSPSHSSTSAGDLRASEGLQSPGFYTCTNRSSVFSQEMTSQEVEVLKQQMEEKEREILELEALLQVRKGDETSYTTPPKASAPITSLPETASQHLHSPFQQTQEEAAQKFQQHPTNKASLKSITCNLPSALISATTEVHKMARSCDPVDEKAAKLLQTSPEVTTVLEMVPDSFPPPASTSPTSFPAYCQSSSLSNQSQMKNSATGTHTHSTESPKEHTNIQAEVKRKGSVTQASFSKEISRAPSAKISSPKLQDTSSHDLISKTTPSPAHEVLKALKSPPQTEYSQEQVRDTPKSSPSTFHHKYAPESATSKKSETKRKTHLVNVGLCSPKLSTLDKFVQKKSSPVSSSESLLQTADKLIKALRSPPKLLHDNQATMEVDAALFKTPSHTLKRTQPRQAIPKDSSSKRKETRQRNSRSPRTSNGVSPTPMPKPARKGTVVVLNSQDTETDSPPPLNVPLPDTHPFLSISTPQRNAAKSPAEQSINPVRVKHLQDGSPVPDCSKLQFTDWHEAATPLSKQSTATQPFPQKHSVIVTPEIQLSGEPPPHTWSETERKQQPLSFVGSGLSKLQLKQAQALAKKYGGRIASCFNRITTHVIVVADENGCCSRTMKYLQGVAAGKWIVDYRWVKDSMEAGTLLPEETYVVKGDFVSGNASYRAHTNSDSGGHGLFRHHNFYLPGQMTTMSCDQLAQLIQLGGGTLISNMDDFLPPVGSKTLVICDSEREQKSYSKRYIVVTSSWVLDSLSACCLQPQSGHQLN